MATSGKKGKKNRGKKVPLQSFLANGNTTPGVTQVSKKVRNRLDDSDDDDGGALPQIYQLPTAPRASRMLDDDVIPRNPPFLAYISNLPFDIREDDIQEFFNAVEIVSLRLPKDDGDSGRSRGFGYIEFGSRDDLIYAIRLPDPHIKNRRIRIDISNENDQQKRGGGNRSRYDNFGNSDGRDSTNWRRNEGGFNKENDERRGGGGGGGYGYNRDRPRDTSQEKGSWRNAERSHFDSSPIRRNFGGRRNMIYVKCDDARKPEEVAQERPKLNLKPRTLPLPVIVTQPEDIVSEKASASEPEPPQPKGRPFGVSAEKVFGAAKPVDTSAREKEIEERLEKEKLEKLKQAEEEKELDQKNSTQTQEENEREEKETGTNWRKRDDERKDDISDRRRLLPHDNNRENNFDRKESKDIRIPDKEKPKEIKDKSERDHKEKLLHKENKPRDNRSKEEKPKREKVEKTSPKYQPPQVGSVLPTSNKYSVFLDEEETSE